MVICIDLKDQTSTSNPPEHWSVLLESIAGTWLLVMPIITVCLATQKSCLILCYLTLLVGANASDIAQECTPIVYEPLGEPIGSSIGGFPLTPFMLIFGLAWSAMLCGIRRFLIYVFRLAVPIKHQPE